MRNRVFKLVFFITLLVLGLDKLGVLKWFRGGLNQLFSGLRKETYQRIVEPGSREEQLKRELFSCQGRIKELEEENFQARRLLDAGFKPETAFTLGKIIAINRFRALVAVDNKSKLRVGASVVSKRVFLGKVSNFAGNQANINFLGAPDFKLPVKIFGNKEQAEKNTFSLAEGILVGEGDDLIVEEILASEVVEIGNMVGVVAESGDVFFAGEIIEVFPSEDKIFQKVKINRLVDPRSLITVGIVQ